MQKCSVLRRSGAQINNLMSKGGSDKLNCRDLGFSCASAVAETGAWINFKLEKRCNMHPLQRPREVHDSKVCYSQFFN
jgi:hypothetical protein